MDHPDYEAQKLQKLLSKIPDKSIDPTYKNDPKFFSNNLFLKNNKPVKVKLDQFNISDLKKFIEKIDSSYPIKKDEIDNDKSQIIFKLKNPSDIVVIRYDYTNRKECEMIIIPSNRYTISNYHTVKSIDVILKNSSNIIVYKIKGDWMPLITHLHG